MGERKPLRLKRSAYNKFQKESLNLDWSWFSEGIWEPTYPEV